MGSLNFSELHVSLLTSETSIMLFPPNIQLALHVQNFYPWLVESEDGKPVDTEG